MIAKVVGFERVEFTDQKTNQTISGTRLYVTFKGERVNGVGCDSKFFSDNANVKLPEIAIGREYEFVYQQTGFSGKSTLVAVKPA